MLWGMRWGWLLSSLLVLGCGKAPHDGETGQTIVDACLHWTACAMPPSIDPPLDFPYCASYADPTLRALPWRADGVAVTPSEVQCLADAGLDCAAALDCVSTPSPTPCDTPTYACDGDTVTLCDSFAGARVVREDCAAEGLHCVDLGEESHCGLGTCDPKTFQAACMGNATTSCRAVTSWDDKSLGGLIVADDCTASDAACAVIDGMAQCVGNGPACVPFDGGKCDGDTLLTCDASGHERRTDCAATGERCVSVGPNPAGIAFACGSKPGLVVCVADPSFSQCHGSSLEYCDDKGNEKLDCTELGYAGCDSGHCVL